MGFLRRLFGGGPKEEPDPGADTWRVERDPSLRARYAPVERPESTAPSQPAWDPPHPYQQRAKFESRRGTPAGTVRLKGGGRVEVVGESRYREVIAGICGECGPEGVNLGFSASLVPEPTNPYDPNAIAVVISGQTVGYLARPAAIAYRPVVTALGDRVGSCNATIRGGFARAGGGQADFGITLDVAEPAVLIAQLSS